jgi:phosphopantetheine adenylyltransferase
MVGGIETVFILASHEHTLTSSTLIKQIVTLGSYKPEEMSRLVPLSVAKRLEEKLRSRAKA